MEKGTVESIVAQLERTMECADSKLGLLSMKLDIFESNFILNDEIVEDKPPDAGTANALGTSQLTNAVGENSSEKAADLREDDDDGIDPKLVRELLFEVTRIKHEYDQLHNEIRQVQELQQEVTQSVRRQMKQVQSHFDSLRCKIIGSGAGGEVKPK